MPQQALPNLGINFNWDVGYDGWKAGMDFNLLALDVHAQPRVADKDLFAPPVSPALGDRYIVGPVPTGAWTNHANDIAVWAYNLLGVAAWVFFIPVEGWECFVVDADDKYRFVGGSWVIAPATGVPALQNRVAALESTAPSDYYSIVTDNTASRSLVLDDISTTRAPKWVRMTSATANEYRVRANANVTAPIGSTLNIRRAGAGATTILAEAGVTINTPFGGSLVLAGAGATVTLVKVATDVWDMAGQVEAA